MNKKGDVPSIMVVVVAILLVVISLFVFITTKSNFQDNSNQLSGMMSELDFTQNYIVNIISVSEQYTANNIGDKPTFQNYITNLNINLNGSVNFFNNINSGDYTFSNNGQTYTFQMPNVVIYVSRGYNSVKRTINFEVDYNKGTGAFTSKITLS